MASFEQQDRATPNLQGCVYDRLPHVAEGHDAYRVNQQVQDGQPANLTGFDAVYGQQNG